MRWANNSIASIFDELLCFDLVQLHNLIKQYSCVCAKFLRNMDAANKSAPTTLQSADGDTSNPDNAILEDIHEDGDTDKTKDLEAVKYFDTHLAEQIREYNALCALEGIAPLLSCHPAANISEYMRVDPQPTSSMNVASTSTSSPSVFRNIPPAMFTAMPQQIHSPIVSLATNPLTGNNGPALANSTLQMQSSFAVNKNANVSNAFIPPTVQSNRASVNISNVSNAVVQQHQATGNQSMPTLDVNAIAQQIDYLQGLLQQAVAQQSMAQQSFPQQSVPNQSNLPNSPNVSSQSMTPQMAVLHPKYNLPLPKFCKKNVEIYFLQLELWFDHRGIANN